jgi:hypothetical protein
MMHVEYALKLRYFGVESRCVAAPSVVACVWVALFVVLLLLWQR